MPVNATRKRINAAAMRLFAERGTTELTVSELATAAGVARGTLYRNVESVEQLFDHVSAQLARDIHDANARAMTAHGQTDPPLRLATAIRMLVRQAHYDAAMGRFLIRFGLTDESLREVLSGAPMHDIEAGIEAGRYPFASGLKLSIASLMTGTVVSAMWMVLEGHQGWREAGAGAAELVLCALGVPHEEARAIAEAQLPELPAL
ncbi:MULTISPECIES: TetR/AcrR family transcriptional regulator [Streptomyces]|uniref:TetR/AcrR family transcriptional regulator n=1 Tax=Streptomyces cylindrosporus TaxID=2927583 RepID=A0ABS9Y0D0_9ACTN|nr:TetR/AcrR family transcriptional regulator [Streptomyces cylindrosporus]MCI3270667.1 TetR/AcrR family transcriptional regulator [Streptomyces cylindrosporus]